MTDVEILKQIPLFSQMDEAEIGAVRAVMDKLEYRAGDTLMHEGEGGDLLHILIAGRVQVIMRDASGAELVVDDIQPGGFFGELAMLTGEPRLARIKALDNVTTLALERHEFFDFLRQYPNAAIDVLIELSKRLHRTDTLLRQSVSRNVNDVVQENLSLGQRVADGFAATIGSWRFIIIQTVILIAWIILNVTAWVNHWDPYPFILLNLALSFQAAYSGPIIMMSQNRQSDIDRLVAEIDHQVNTKAELEVGHVIQRLDDVERILHQNHREHLAQLQLLQMGGARSTGRPAQSGKTPARARK
jgi:uncharacterized membrane protein